MVKAQRKIQPHSATGGIVVDEARYTLKLSPPLDASLSKMAERMEMDKGKVISHALTVLALALENKRRSGGDIALLDKNEVVVRVIPIDDNGLPGDLEITEEGEAAES